MKASAAEHLGLWRTGLASRLVIFATVLAFLLQSFIAQTHIHGASLTLGRTVEIATAQPPAREKKPADNGAIDCPFCQAVVHAGAFLAPAPQVLLPPTWVIIAAQFITLRPVAVAATHSWRSRAPPQP
jgi:hypothetical protein